MNFSILSEGFVTSNPTLQGRPALAVGSRCAALDDGSLLCSLMLTSRLGTNDFVPVLYRSADGGTTWTAEGPVWPELQQQWSMFVSISRDPGGRLLLFGSRSAIDVPGETFWSDATQGIRQNELIWAASDDGGRRWSGPTPIPMPIPGSAEAPGALCVTSSGRWIAPYSPYNTFDPQLAVDRSQVVVVFSDDCGVTWQHSSMVRFSAPDLTAAEAWVTELTDVRAGANATRKRRLLGTAWQLDQSQGTDRPNAFALSLDGGQTWEPTRSTGILGQSTALAATRDGRGLFIYNQRKHGEIGVWLALVDPTPDDFGIVHNQIVWKAPVATQSGTSGAHAEWEDFSFGEPSITVLPDGTLLATIWCLQAGKGAIRYVRLRLCE